MFVIYLGYLNTKIDSITTERLSKYFLHHILHAIICSVLTFELRNFLFLFGVVIEVAKSNSFIFRASSMIIRVYAQISSICLGNFLPNKPQ